MEEAIKNFYYEKNDFNNIGFSLRENSKSQRYSLKKEEDNNVSLYKYNKEERTWIRTKNVNPELFNKIKEKGQCTNKEFQEFFNSFNIKIQSKPQKRKAKKICEYKEEEEKKNFYTVPFYNENKEECFKTIEKGKVNFFVIRNNKLYQVENYNDENPPKPATLKEIINSEKIIEDIKHNTGKTEGEKEVSIFFEKEAIQYSINSIEDNNFSYERRGSLHNPRIETPETNITAENETITLKLNYKEIDLETELILKKNGDSYDVYQKVKNEIYLIDKNSELSKYVIETLNKNRKLMLYKKDLSDMGIKSDNNIGYQNLNMKLEKTDESANTTSQEKEQLTTSYKKNNNKINIEIEKDGKSLYKAEKDIRPAPAKNIKPPQKNNPTDLFKDEKERYNENQKEFLNLLIKNRNFYLDKKGDLRDCDILLETDETIEKNLFIEDKATIKNKLSWENFREVLLDFSKKTRYWYTDIDLSRMTNKFREGLNENENGKRDEGYLLEKEGKKVFIAVGQIDSPLDCNSTEHQKILTNKTNELKQKLNDENIRVIFLNKKNIRGNNIHWVSNIEYYDENGEYKATTIDSSKNNLQGDGNTCGVHTATAMHDILNYLTDTFLGDDKLTDNKTKERIEIYKNKDRKFFQEIEAEIKGENIKRKKEDTLPESDPESESEEKHPRDTHQTNVTISSPIINAPIIRESNPEPNSTENFTKKITMKSVDEANTIELLVDNKFIYKKINDEYIRIKEISNISNNTINSIAKGEIDEDGYKTLIGEFTDDPNSFYETFPLDKIEIEDYNLSTDSCKDIFSEKSKNILTEGLKNSELNNSLGAIETPINTLDNPDSHNFVFKTKIDSDKHTIEDHIEVDFKENTSGKNIKLSTKIPPLSSENKIEIKKDDITITSSKEGDTEQLGISLLDVFLNFIRYVLINIGYKTKDTENYYDNLFKKNDRSLFLIKDENNIRSFSAESTENKELNFSKLEKFLAEYKGDQEHKIKFSTLDGSFCNLIFYDDKEEIKLYKESSGIEIRASGKIKNYKGLKDKLFKLTNSLDKGNHEQLVNFVKNICEADFKFDCEDNTNDKNKHLAKPNSSISL